MENALPKEGRSVPPGSAARKLDRLTSFRVIYLAIFSFLLLWVISVGLVETALDAHFRSALAEATDVDPTRSDLASRIHERVDEAVRGSLWVRAGGVDLVAFVFGADGRLIYPGGPLPERDPMAAIGEAGSLLPVSTDLRVSVPYNAVISMLILVFFAATHVQALFVYYGRMTRREEERLGEAQRARDETAGRAERIERELEQVQARLDSVVPIEGKHAEEIRTLRGERAGILAQLAALTEREEELREQTAQAAGLEEERRTLEELLDEALEDLRGKDDEIRGLQARLKRAARETPVREREQDAIARRLRTLYKNLEVDDRAIRDLIALRDEPMKLKAEEAMKRLSDEADNAAVRRKVGGLPPNVPIFELGFAGKGRVYYTNGSQRRYRILTVGAKNTQKTDLEYLHRVAKGIA